MLNPQIPFLTTKSPKNAKNGPKRLQNSPKKIPNFSQNGHKLWPTTVTKLKQATDVAQGLIQTTGLLGAWGKNKHPCTGCTARSFHQLRYQCSVFSSPLHPAPHTPAPALNPCTPPDISRPVDRIKHILDWINHVHLGHTEFKE
jgi:hypothetical protein